MATGRSNPRSKRCPAALPGAVLLLATSPQARSSAPQPGVEHADIVIRDYRFDPADITVRVGTTVRWTNDEKRTSHSVLFAAPAIGESERLFPGEHREWRFDAAGIYRYGCGPHPEMHGSVTVSD